MSPVSAETKAPVTHFPAPARLAAALEPSVGDLRRAVAASTWSVNERLKDSDRPPVYPLGGTPEGLKPANQSQRIEWQQVFAVPPRNPHLLRLAVDRGLAPREALNLLPQVPPVEPGPRPRGPIPPAKAGAEQGRERKKRARKE